MTVSLGSTIGVDIMHVDNAEVFSPKYRQKQDKLYLSLPKLTKVFNNPYATTFINTEQLTITYYMKLMSCIYITKI